MTYLLLLAPEHSDTINAELRAFLQSPRLIEEVGHLMAGLAELSDRGAPARDRNVCLSSVEPQLYRVTFRSCAAYYTYVSGPEVPMLILLGFCRNDGYFRDVANYADRIRTLAKGK